MRLALGIEYDGTGFQGWQRLSHANSVQSAVESALSFVADAPIEVQCAGRTDAGVHALCQVVHCDTAAQRPPRGWMLGANSRLPCSVTVRWAVPVPDAFHARHGARARRYRYRILNRPVRPSLQRDYLAWERLPLDAEAMHRAAQVLLGEHDFSAFRAAQCQATHAMREMQQISVRRDGEEVVIDVRANAFLHHMVRNIVGSLLPIGRGERPEWWMGELLRGRDRTVAGATALPQGLTFIGPLYPAHWGLPAEATL
ncbi:MAG TPA: tRNA pseudouridine(38-40) synthase TruA [Xanthomonadaceae bacterium]|jgi:tRNA pseudouridine38-40 synthase|nr:tRNA pseudouridine(38-40) synthase TruA [Xanthomonadaceae bacterium]